MATNSYSDVIFSHISQSAFYFQVDEVDADVEVDHFRRSDLQRSHLMIGDGRDKFLILSDENQFEAQNLTVRQQQQPGCKFNIQYYQDSKFKKETKAVIIYAVKDGKKMLACCNQNGEIYPEEMDLPQEIQGSEHKAVFYQKKLLASDKYQLESSLRPLEFLGFKVDGGHALKLVLIPKREDEVDEGCQVLITNE